MIWPLTTITLPHTRQRRGYFGRVHKCKWLFFWFRANQPGPSPKKIRKQFEGDPEQINTIDNSYSYSLPSLHTCWPVPQFYGNLSFPVPNIFEGIDFGLVLAFFLLKYETWVGSSSDFSFFGYIHVKPVSVFSSIIIGFQ